MIVPEYPVWVNSGEGHFAPERRLPQPIKCPITVIDVEWVAERALGLAIRPIPGSELDLGWMVRWPGVRGEPLIIVDQGLFDSPSHTGTGSPLRRKQAIICFTCLTSRMWRIGGAVIHLYSQLENWETVERNAKRFAAALLMPMELV